MRAKLVRKKYSLISGGTHISPAIKKNRFWDVTHASSDLFFLCFSTELTAKYLILKRKILDSRYALYYRENARFHNNLFQLRWFVY